MSGKLCTSQLVILNGVCDVKNPGIFRCAQNDRVDLAQSFPGWPNSIPLLVLTAVAMRPPKIGPAQITHAAQLTIAMAANSAFGRGDGASGWRKRARRTRR
ncbi:MAG TPA: hypothetical protein VND20_03250 [Candidatus Binataceae bacterium]|nr:hypothetical protein [Candidatus Binataceae bacterium]